MADLHNDIEGAFLLLTLCLVFIDHMKGGGRESEDRRKGIRRMGMMNGPNQRVLEADRRQGRFLFQRDDIFFISFIPFSLHGGKRKGMQMNEIVCSVATFGSGGRDGRLGRSIR